MSKEGDFVLAIVIFILAASFGWSVVSEYLYFIKLLIHPLGFRTLSEQSGIDSGKDRWQWPTRDSIEAINQLSNSVVAIMTLIGMCGITSVAVASISGPSTQGIESSESISTKIAASEYPCNLLHANVNTRRSSSGFTSLDFGLRIGRNTSAS